RHPGERSDRASRGAPSRADRSPGPRVGDSRGAPDRRRGHDRRATDTRAMMDLDALAEYLGRITIEVASGGHGVGAGVVSGPEWVVTNAHVVARAPVVVRGPDGQRTEALVVATNREADLAMLRVPGLSLAAPWAVAP